MEISGTTNTNNVTQQPQSSGAVKTLGKDDFLRLFTEQLKAQDPLNPMDSSGFTAQLAQFSSLEQLTNINTQLQNMLLFQSSLQNTMTTDLIGRQVKLTDGEVHAVTGIRFDNSQTLLDLDNGSTVQLGGIKEILGGA